MVEPKKLLQKDTLERILDILDKDCSRIEREFKEGYLRGARQNYILLLKHLNICGDYLPQDELIKYATLSLGYEGQLYNH